MAKWPHWHLLCGRRMVYLWHQHPYAGTGAVWDDTNRRLTAHEAAAVADMVQGDVPWRDILAAWSTLPDARDDSIERRIYGRDLTPGARTDD